MWVSFYIIIIIIMMKYFSFETKHWNLHTFIFSSTSNVCILNVNIIIVTNNIYMLILLCIVCVCVWKKRENITPSVVYTSQRPRFNSNVRPTIFGWVDFSRCGNNDGIRSHIWAKTCTIHNIDSHVYTSIMWL